MILSAIAAIGKNNELGKGNDLVFKMPADMKYFRDTTRGHAIIMGRKNFESLPAGPLPNRRNIVITRNTDYKPDGVEIVHSLEEALALFKDSNEEVFNIGGGEIFRMAMPLTDRLYITRVDATCDADVFFPEIGPEWREMSREEHPADAENAWPYTFIMYEKTA